jgi:hypothetical protein
MTRRVIAVACALALLAATSGITPIAAAASPEPVDPAAVSDPALLQAIDEAPSESTRLQVEIVDDDTRDAAAAAKALGAIVTGGVPGEVVQVSIAAGRIDDLAARVEHVRVPLVANRPVTGSVELGPTTGEGLAVLRAQSWHDRGLTGAVKVGIVDFFDLTRWNVAENGPLPDANHVLCRDSSASGFCTGQRFDGDEHGVAVAEIVKDIAPAAELYLATVGTVSDLAAAIDWFAANGVQIITRSLGAAYDGPGDGTGPLAAVVDRAAARGITWFNSAGNDAAGQYGRFTEGVDRNGYVDFLPGPGVDTTLSVSPSPFTGCLGFDGVRWSDWGQPATVISDYVVEVRSASGALIDVHDARQRNGAPPLEATDALYCQRVEVSIRRKAGGDPTADVVEVALFDGTLEHSQAAFSAAKPVVDSRSPALVAVGAVDPPTGSTLGFYSSQGPTNDGRTKPDASAPSCVTSSVYAPPIYGCFAGTSAAAPAAAAMAAVLYGAGLAASGAPLAALTMHLTTDLGAPGRDNQFGAGVVRLPAPPPAALDTRPAAFNPITPRRILDTRPESATAGTPRGPFPPFSIVDLPVGLPGASAVAVSIVSVGAVGPGYVQALPTLMASIASSSTINVDRAGEVRPNFAVVPVGADGSISFFLFSGGDIVVDIVGWFGAAAGPVGPGRFVAVDPVRIADTRPESPVPADRAPGKPSSGSSVLIGGIPAGAAAVVVNVTSDQAEAPGYLRAQPTGVVGLGTSTGNFVRGLASSTLAIVPVNDGSISVVTSAPTHVVVDLVGYVTGPDAPVSSTGLFVPVGPVRTLDTRTGPALTSLVPIRIPVAGTGSVPAGASAVSFNLTSDQTDAPGYITVHPAEQPTPLVSSLNYPALNPRANAVIMGLGPSGAMHALSNRTSHVIIDVNGYFTG